MTTYIQLTIFYYWRHIVPFISSLYYSTLELIDPFLYHPSFYALAIHLLPGPVISHHLHPYSLIAIKARCVCQTLFQRVIHSRYQQQGGNLVSIAGCPTKRAMPRLIWRLIISTYLLLRPRKPYKCVPPEEWGCCRYLYRLVMTCFKKTTFCRLIALQLSLMPELEQSSII